MKKKKIKRILLSLLLLLLVLVFSYSAVQIYTVQKEYTEGKETYDALADMVTVIKETTAGIDTAERIQETAPISVDFDALKAQNEDVIGWLYCADTEINYPVLQSDDNDYYLRRMINREYNSAGSLFMDYRCKADCSSSNTIIYGHHMKNGSMFATLVKYKDADYYDEHPVMWYLTPERDYKIELIAGCVLSLDHQIYNADFTEQEMARLIDECKGQSSFTSEIGYSAGDHIMTLSTCSYEYSGARYVLVGKIVPLEKR